jgi:hypothetical protein
VALGSTQGVAASLLTQAVAHRCGEFVGRYVGHRCDALDQKNADGPEQNGMGFVGPKAGDFAKAYMVVADSPEAILKFP